MNDENNENEASMSVDELFDMGYQYEVGYGDCEQNADEAIRWYEKAADAGNSEAALRIISIYVFNKESGENGAEIEKWERRAAELGNAAAQYEMGRSYEMDRWGTNRMAEAVYWYRKSAEQGNRDAQYCLGNCYLSGKGVEKDAFKAKKWLAMSGRGE